MTRGIYAVVSAPPSTASPRPCAPKDGTGGGLGSYHENNGTGYGVRNGQHAKIERGANKTQSLQLQNFSREVSNNGTLQRARCNGQARLPRPGDGISCGPASPGPPWSGECVSQGRIDSCIGLWRCLGSARGTAEAEALEMAVDFWARERLR